MVEGPGCKLKGEKLKTAVVGQKVVAVRGNVIDNRPKWATDKETDFHQFVEQSDVTIFIGHIDVLCAIAEVDE